MAKPDLTGNHHDICGDLQDLVVDLYYHGVLVNLLDSLATLLLAIAAIPPVYEITYIALTGLFFNPPLLSILFRIMVMFKTRFLAIFIFFTFSPISGTAAPAVHRHFQIFVYQGGQVPLLSF